MKTFTARDLNKRRNEIREAIKDGGCIVQFKYSNREIELEAVIMTIEDYDVMVKKVSDHKHKK